MLGVATTQGGAFRPSTAQSALVVWPAKPLQTRMNSDTPTARAVKVPASEASPEDLLFAVADRRDREAFKQLFATFGPRVKGYLMRQGAGGSAAEDLMQDVMLTLWHRAAQFDRKKASLSTWIFTIARNRRIDSLRRARRPEIDPDDPALVREPEAAADRTVEASQRRVR